MKAKVDQNVGLIPTKRMYQIRSHEFMMETMICLWKKQLESTHKHTIPYLPHTLKRTMQQVPLLLLLLRYNRVETSVIEEYFTVCIYTCSKYHAHTAQPQVLQNKQVTFSQATCVGGRSSPPLADTAELAGDPLNRPSAEVDDLTHVSNKQVQHHS